MTMPLGKGVRAPQDGLIIDKSLITNDLRLHNLAGHRLKNTPFAFLRHVRIDGFCWLWTGRISQGGYGQFEGEAAHRFAYRWLRGPIPAGQCVLHRCDRPPCVNPAHLFLGTLAENCLDRTRKNRSACKLTPEQVAAIRARRGPHRFRGPPYLKDLAAEYGVTVPTISMIVRGKRRQHLLMEPSCAAS